MYYLTAFYFVAMFIAAADGTIPNDRGTAKAYQTYILERYWMEVKVQDSHKVATDPNALACFGYHADEIVVWGRRGELSAGKQTGGKVIVRADVKPMQIDFLFSAGDKVYATPAIFRFEGPLLVVVEPMERGAVPFRDDGKYPNRPTDFTTTKVNKHQKRVLKPCGYYDVD